MTKKKRIYIYIEKELKTKLSSQSHTSKTHKDNKNGHRASEPPEQPRRSQPRGRANVTVADKYAGATKHVARAYWVHKKKCVVQEG